MKTRLILILMFWWIIRQMNLMLIPFLIPLLTTGLIPFMSTGMMAMEINKTQL